MKMRPTGKEATSQYKVSRREFVAQSAFYGGIFLTLWNLPRPLTVQAAQESSEPEVLSGAEWNTVEAITGRIIPTDDDPGAIEANCVNFIDKALAREDSAQRPTYKAGLSGIDSVSETTFGNTFVKLTSGQQDSVLIAIESGKARGWSSQEIPPEDFFSSIRAHTIIAFLADPKYGGNHNYAGWKLLGYPGPRHTQGGYTPEQMLGTQKIKTIWGEEI